MTTIKNCEYCIKGLMKLNGYNYICKSCGYFDSRVYDEMAVSRPITFLPRFINKLMKDGMKIDHGHIVDITNQFTKLKVYSKYLSLQYVLAYLIISTKKWYVDDKYYNDLMIFLYSKVQKALKDKKRAKLINHYMSEIRKRLD